MPKQLQTCYELCKNNFFCKNEVSHLRYIYFDVDIHRVLCSFSLVLSHPRLKHHPLIHAEANRIKPSSLACQTDTGSPARTSYSIWPSVFVALGIVSFDTGINPSSHQRHALLLPLQMTVCVPPSWLCIVRSD